MQNEKGLSLTELLIAIFLAITIALTMSVAFSQSSSHTIKNRQRTVASYLAGAQLETLKSQPYSALDATDALVSLPSFTALQCDCTQVTDFSVFPSTVSVVTGTTFTLAACVNAVARTGNTWVPQCSTGADTGYKNILVKVWWVNGSTTYSTTQESMLMRN